MIGNNSQLEMNIKAYKEMEEDLLEHHFGKTALLHDGELIGVFDEKQAASKAGMFKYGEGNYSLKIIDRKAIRFRPRGPAYRPAGIGTS